MSDDIVTQLREIQWEHDKTWQDKMFEAADEIERLREDVIYWQALSYCPKCGCGQCQDNEEALNNE